MRIGFIGLGNMGGPMAANLLKAGHQVSGFDVVPSALDKFSGTRAASIATAAKDAELIVTMLPAGTHVDEVYRGGNGILASAATGALLIDSSTIDVKMARAVAAHAKERGFDMVDAPVSGGVAGASAGTLTFMVGGSEEAFARALPALQKMGKSVVHAGASGAGQAAKICNNLILGISMIAVSEAFDLATKLGLDHQKLFDISAKSSGQCWSLTSYCPVPGPVPTSPANHEYQPGFTAAMMLKDLNIATETASDTRAAAPLTRRAAEIYQRLNTAGLGTRDFSVIYRFLADARDGFA